MDMRNFQKSVKSDNQIIMIWAHKETQNGDKMDLKVLSLLSLKLSEIWIILKWWDNNENEFNIIFDVL